MPDQPGSSFLYLYPFRDYDLFAVDAFIGHVAWDELFIAELSLSFCIFIQSKLQDRSLSCQQSTEQQDRRSCCSYSFVKVHI